MLYPSGTAALQCSLVQLSSGTKFPAISLRLEYIIKLFVAHDASV
jgi:hypothetical protein